MGLFFRTEEVKKNKLRKIKKNLQSTGRVLSTRVGPTPKQAVSYEGEDMKKARPSARGGGRCFNLRRDYAATGKRAIGLDLAGTPGRKPSGSTPLPRLSTTQPDLLALVRRRELVSLCQALHGHSLPTEQRGSVAGLEQGFEDGDELDDSLLHAAIRAGSLASAALLLAHRPWHRHDSGIESSADSALHLATRVKSPAAVRLLIDHGDDPWATNCAGETAFDLATTPRVRAALRLGRGGGDELVGSGTCASADTAVVDTTAKSLVKPDTVPPGAGAGNLDPRWDPLMSAIHFGGHDEVEALLVAGADLVIRDTTGLAPLHRAAALGRPDVTATLLRYGARVDVASARNETPLHFACFAQSAEVVELLLAHGADPTALNDDGLSPAHLAPDTVVENGRAQGIRAALAKFPVPNTAPWSAKAVLPLHGVIKAGQELRPGWAASTRDKRDVFGRTALHLCAQYNRPEIAVQLMRAGCRCDAEGPRKITPIQFAEKVR